MELSCPPAVQTSGNDEIRVQEPPGEEAPPEELPVIEETSQEEFAAEEPAVEVVEKPQKEPVNVELPQRMKANRIVAGRICPACNVGIALGENVFNCQKCSSSMHGFCFDKHGHCANSECEDGQLVLQKKSKLHMKIASPTEDSSNDDSVPCRFCGEKIRQGALKCRFCGEFQNDADRKRQEKVNNYSNYSDDDTLSWGDVLFCVLCSGLACIFGIVYVFQGKGKGWKMIGLSLLVQIIIVAIRSMLKK